MPCGLNQLEKHEQTLQRIKLTFKKIEINIKRNTNELSPMITATMSNDDDNNVETIEHVNYPKGLTSGLLNAINKFISNYNYQDVGKVRIITIRTLIKLVKLRTPVYLQVHPKLDLRTTRFKDLLDLRNKTQLPSYFTKYQHSI